VDNTIPEKANRVLNIILLGLLLILIRVWYLATIQYDEHVEMARRPQRRSAVEKVERATIRDRFNIPLALNKIQYTAAVCYADIRQIPSVRWEKGPNGKKVRVQERVEYIHRLAELLGKELKMDPQKVEDTIHGKACLFPHTPFVIKEDLTEKEYYRLKMLEKNWTGIRTERGSKRYYPQGKIASDVIGFMGAISSNEYYAIAQEISTLQTYLSERETGNMPMLPKGFQNALQVRERLKQLQEKAYTINDSVGKSGVEAAFDPELRGYAGKKTYEVDIKGNLIRELPGSRKSLSGQRLLLSISTELQEYAEQLLTENEELRESKNKDGTPSLSTPWIKGGAIVAMDPKTGEVLALASYPRIELNDFIPSKVQGKKPCINKWLENEAYIGEIWEGKRPLERERYDPVKRAYYEEQIPLSLLKYFEATLSSDGTTWDAMEKVADLRGALIVQQEIEKLLRFSGQPDVRVLCAALYHEHRPSQPPINEEEWQAVQERLKEVGQPVVSAKSILDYYLGGVTYNDDKLLVIDLCRLLVSNEHFSSELVDQVGHINLATYRVLSQLVIQAQSYLQAQAKEWFHQIDFLKWRQEHFKDYLKMKRKEERDNKRYAKPYTDYLERIEKEMFKEFWKENRWDFTHCFIQGNSECNSPYVEKLLALRESDSSLAEKITFALSDFDPSLQFALMKTMRSFEELNRPLSRHYRTLRNTKGVQLEKHLAGAFYPLTGFGYGRSQAFRQATPQGSVFKIVVAYQALLERYKSLQEQNLQLKNLNPLTLIDDLKWHAKANSHEQVLGYTIEGQPILRMYKGGKLPRSHPRIGKIDIVGAIEQSSNIYFSILANEHIQDPLNLIQAAKHFGFGHKTGIELPGEISGTLPDDLSHNRTGLYSFAIGQHSLVVTPLQTAVMMSSIANHGQVLKPTIVQVIAGQEPLRDYHDPFACETYPFKENLSLIGIDFPLFSSTQTEMGRPQVWCSAPEVRESLFLPETIRHPLMEGMHRVIAGTKGTARPEIIRAFSHHPAWKRDYQDLKQQIVGKTGTAEILYKQNIDVEAGAKIHNHIWFGGAAFESGTEFENQDLVVVVYLRFSEAGGKEAAPLAVEMVKKWREIRANHGKSSYVAIEAIASIP